MPALVVVPVAATAVMSDLVIERYDYAFDEAGQPIIKLTVQNPDAKALYGDIGINVSQAIESAQNEYVYKNISKTKGPRNFGFLPGKEQIIFIRKGPLLVPGMYEAEIRLEGQDELKSQRYDFQVSNAAYEQAMVRRGDKRSASLPKNPQYTAIRDISFIVLSGLIVLVGIKNLWKAVLEKKRRGSRDKNQKLDSR
ncbi:hypothetical protein [Paenibacillus sp. OV219]|uniref:hypothetical protein n=1 Tax=Paenibacillus sp. OV219 TaxID=1884377 RepID=UPI0008CBE3FB|nr:hypothetical protein [Paenibacillus sp. OV219]SEM54226.1 hypothetical protein SAMN05518847_101108 [Paenibacillus sp. OV219]